MAINPNLMVVGPDIQEVFIDPATNLPLSGGNIFFYSDSSRSDLQPVYELTGTSSSGYTFTQLPNPVPLSGAGTPQNGAGQDIVIYYYPFNAEGLPSQYYVVVKDSSGNTILTRQDWPPNTSGGIGPIPGASNYLYNFVRNSTFYSWSNGTSFLNVGLGSTDGLDFMPDDWVYMQNDSTQNINISQGVFNLGFTGITGDNPPYYLLYSNTSAGSMSQTVNQFSQRYKSVQTLAGKQVTVSLWLMVSTPFSTQNISVSVTQFFGTGGSPSASITTQGLLIPGTSLSSSWQQFTGTFTIPAITGTPGTNLDDALILNINMPLSVVTNVGIDKVVMQVGSMTQTQAPEMSNDDIRQNTDVIGLYPAFTTGDVKPTIKIISDPGWLLMDDTTIGSPLSGATHTGFKYFNLFNMIWTNIHSTIWAPIFTSAGVLTTYGGASASDWGSNARLSLTKILGRALASAGQAIVTNATTLTVTGSSTTTVFNTNDVSSFYVGMPVQYTITGAGVLPSGIAALTTYYIVNPVQVSPGVATFQLSTTSANAVAGVIIDLHTSSAGTAPFYAVSTFSSQVLGSYLGQNSHALTVAELPSHTHTLAFNTVSGGAGGNVFQAGTNTPYNPANTGGNVPFNILQPTGFMNFMIKL